MIAYAFLTRFVHISLFKFLAIAAHHRYTKPFSIKDEIQNHVTLQLLLTCSVLAKQLDIVSSKLQILF